MLRERREEEENEGERAMRREHQRKDGNRKAEKRAEKSPIHPPCLISSSTRSISMTLTLSLNSESLDARSATRKTCPYLPFQTRSSDSVNWEVSKLSFPLFSSLSPLSLPSQCTYKHIVFPQRQLPQLVQNKRRVDLRQVGVYEPIDVHLHRGERGGLASGLSGRNAVIVRIFDHRVVFGVGRASVFETHHLLEEELGLHVRFG